MSQEATYHDPDQPIPPRFAEEELVARLERCIDEAVGDMNITSIEIVGALETLKFTHLHKIHFEDDE